MCVALSAGGVRISLLKQYLSSFSPEVLEQMGFEKSEIAQAQDEVEQTQQEVNKLKKSEVVTLLVEDEDEPGSSSRLFSVLPDEGVAVEKLKGSPPSSKIDLSAELTDAAVKGNIKEIERLLKSGADINGKDCGGTPLLANALMNKQAEAVRFILFFGLSGVPLYQITSVDIEELEELLDDNSDPAQDALNAFKEMITQERLKSLELSIRLKNFLDPAEQLAKAAMCGKVAEMQELLKPGPGGKRKVDINEKWWGVSFLEHALVNRQAGAVRFILLFSPSGAPLYQITSGDIEELEELIGDRSDPARNTLNAFREIIAEKRLEGLELSARLKKFLENEPKPQLIFSKDPPVEQLAEAARRGKVVEMERLLKPLPGGKKKVDINEKDWGGTSLLAQALMNKAADSVEFILKNPDYRITEIDIEEAADLISDTNPLAQSTLLVFQKTVKPNQLEGLDVSLIKSILPVKTLQTLKLVI